MSDSKSKLVASLEEIPGLEHKPWLDRTDGFSTLHFRGREIGHFHNFNELDLRLGRNLIAREGLSHHSDSKNHPNRANSSHYIELRFERETDLAKVIQLVKLTISNLSK